jgi:hypothetical protein
MLILAILAALTFALQERVFDPKLLRVEGFPESTTNEDHAAPCILLRLTKADAPYFELAEEQSIEFRIAGKWLAPEALHGRILTMEKWPGCGQVGVIPNRRGLEAFRLHLKWRQMSLRDEAENWLVGNRGWWVPKVCYRLYPLLPKQRKWRQTVIEMEIPKQPWWSAPGFEPHEDPHNQHAALDTVVTPSSPNVANSRRAGTNVEMASVFAMLHVRGSRSEMKRNKSSAPGRRPRFPLGALGGFSHVVCASRSSPAAVGEAQRFARP